jgi:hypothetical protein
MLEFIENNFENDLGVLTHESDEKFCYFIQSLGLLYKAKSQTKLGKLE